MSPSLKNLLMILFSVATGSAGQLVMMREIEKITGKPGAFIETDLVDPRYFSAANVKNRLESYFQMIDQKRRAGGSAAAAGA
jgi:benzoyl-CoA reductase subunit B